MLYKCEGFWEKEKNSPFFSRSGFNSERDLLMILPRFRNLLRLVRSPKHNFLNNKGNNKDTGNSTSSSSSSSSSSSTSNNGNESELVVSDVIDDINQLTLTSTTNASSTTDTSTSTDPNTSTTDTNSSTSTTNTTNTNPTTNPTTTTNNTSGNSSSLDAKKLEEMRRIFILDAERTFVAPEHRQVLLENLLAVYHALGDYHQGEGFLVALLSIYLTRQELAEVLCFLAQHVFVGYFSGTPHAYVLDARVAFLLLREGDAELHAKLEALIVPEAFMSKWLVGFFVHVFSFEWVANALNYLLVRGPIFLFQLALAFFGHFRAELMGEADLGRVLEILRLDEKMMPKSHEHRNRIYQAIVLGALEVILDPEEVAEFRRIVKEEMDRQADKRRLQMLEYESDDEIVFSDED